MDGWIDGWKERKRAEEKSFSLFYVLKKKKDYKDKSYFIVKV